jgi:hypothetical protein
MHRRRSWNWFNTFWRHSKQTRGMDLWFARQSAQDYVPPAADRAELTDVGSKRA